MTRFLGMAMLGLALVVTLRAEDPSPVGKEAEPVLKKKKKDTPREGTKESGDKKPPDNKPEDKKPDPEKKEPKKPLPDLEPLQEKGSGLDLAELVARIKKNLSATEERLEQKKDPGKETRTLQDQIVKDLDELIKQQDENEGGSGGGGGGGRSGRAGGSSGTKGGGSASKGRGAKGGGPKAGGNSGVANQGGDNQGTAGNKSGAGNKVGANAGKGSQTGNNQAGAKGGGGLKGKTDQEKKKNTVADLFPGIWGHYPPTKRMEMDAYSRERFLQRYEDVLRQYYRTIAEQNRRKQGE